MCVLVFEEVVKRVENSGEGDVSDERNLKPREKASHALLGRNLLDRVPCVLVLAESDHFKARLDDNQRVTNDCL